MGGRHNHLHSVNIIGQFLSHHGSRRVDASAVTTLLELLSPHRLEPRRLLPPDRPPYLKQDYRHLLSCSPSASTAAHHRRTFSYFHLLGKAPSMSTPPPQPQTERDPKSPAAAPASKRQKTTDKSASMDAAVTAPATTTSTNTLPVHPATSTSSDPVPSETMEATTIEARLAKLEQQVHAIAPLQIKRLAPEASLPTRGSEFAAGYDLYASRETVVPKGGKVLVDTDISMAVPEGTYGRIAPRSGLAAKHHIDTGAGVIDADYRGPVKVLLFNHSDVDFPVKAGDRVAQLVLERIVTPQVVEVGELADSVRGAGGFGSTGK